MKFGNYCLRYAKNVNVGDTIGFTNSRMNFVVEDITTTAIGLLRFTYGSGTASTCYGPEEMLYVEVQP